MTTEKSLIGRSPLDDRKLGEYGHTIDMAEDRDQTMMEQNTKNIVENSQLIKLQSRVIFNEIHKQW